MTSAAAPAAARPHPVAGNGSHPAPSRTTSFDFSQTIDINNISMYVTNIGSFAWNLGGPGQPAGFEFPKGSGKTAVFAGGLWLGAKVNGAIRITVAEYSQEYGPGAVLGSGMGAAPDDPSKPEYKVYKLNRVYADTSRRDSALADYNAGALPHGAPPVSVDPGNGSLTVLGDQMTWAVYNDLDPAQHTNQAGGTAPLGVEVQQTTYAYDSPGALGNTVFIKFRIINKGANQLDEMFVGAWSDPDLGGFNDDLVGCDVGRSVGFVYNSTNNDAVYGTSPPCVGFDLLKGPTVNALPLGLTSFTKYVNGTDPNTPRKTYHFMQGLDADSNVVINPVTNAPTTFMVSGDPVASTGWLDSIPGDRRMLLSSGPFSMAPGEAQEVVVGIIVGQGQDRLASITAMGYFDDAAQAIFDAPTEALLSMFQSSPRAEAIELRWRLSAGAALAEVHLQRAESASGPWSPAAVELRSEGEITVALDRGVEPGRTYHYRLVAAMRNGDVVTLGQLAAAAWAAVQELTLAPVAPNPGRGPVGIEYSVPGVVRVRLSVLDLQGREVAVLVDRPIEPGRHHADWNGRTVRGEAPTGVYFVRLQGLGRGLTRRAVVSR